MRRLAALLIFTAAFLSAAPVFAADPVGGVVEIEGSATIARPGEPVAALNPNYPVTLKDVIETGPGSRVLLLLIDDTQFIIGENARLLIDEFVYDPDNKTRSKGLFSVLKGPFIYTSGLIGQTQDHDIAIITPYGSLGIRGTTVWGGMLDNEYGVLVQEGEVTVRNDGGVTKLFPGEGIFMRGPNYAPERGGWTDERKARAVATITLSDQKSAQEKLIRQKEINRQRRVWTAEKLRERRGEDQKNWERDPKKWARQRAEKYKRP